MPLSPYLAAIDPRLENNLELLITQNTQLEEAENTDQNILEEAMYVSVHIRSIKAQIEELLRWGNTLFFRTSFQKIENLLFPILSESLQVLNKMPAEATIQNYRTSSLAHIKAINELMIDFRIDQELRGV